MAKFEVVEDETDSPPGSSTLPHNVTPLQQKPPLTERLALDALALGLGALSKRMITAIADLFMLATVGSAFWLWWITPDPNLYQIVSLSIYALFVLTANWIVRRK